MKKFWNELKIYERICVFVGIICTTLIVALFLTSKGAIETVMPPVLCIGMVEFAAGGIYIWRRSKKKAVRSFGGVLIAGIMLFALIMGWL